MYFKKGNVLSIEQERSTIHLEDGQTLLWETGNLPPSLHVGAEVMLEIKDRKSAEKTQQELAAEILHEIFNHAPVLDKKRSSF